MQKFHRPSTASRSPAWLAVVLLLVMFGQSLLPTVASIRAGSSPALWDEVCSVYSPHVSGAASHNQGPATHQVSCPACLHMVADIIFTASQAPTVLSLILLREISHPNLLASSHYARRITPKARAPPYF